MRTGLKPWRVANNDHLPRGFHRRLVRRDVPADGGHGVDTDKVSTNGSVVRAVRAVAPMRARSRSDEIICWVLSNFCCRCRLANAEHCSLDPVSDPNGRDALAEVDQRYHWAKCYRESIADCVNDLSGPDAPWKWCSIALSWVSPQRPGRQGNRPRDPRSLGAAA